MSTSSKIATTGNVYVNLDCALPASLRLSVGQSLIFVRAFSFAGGPFLHSLTMPSPCFVSADDVRYGTQIAGQPSGTYIVALGLVHSAGTGEIAIQFASRSPGSVSPRPKQLKFTITN